MNEITCPECKSHAVHLQMITNITDNKLNLHFYCDACDKDWVTRVWSAFAEEPNVAAR